MGYDDRVTCTATRRSDAPGWRYVIRWHDECRTEQLNDEVRSRGWDPWDLGMVGPDLCVWLRRDERALTDADDDALAELLWAAGVDEVRFEGGQPHVISTRPEAAAEVAS